MGAAAVVPLLIFTAVISAGAAIQQGRVTAAAEKNRQDQLDEQAFQQGLSTRDELNERRRQIALELGEQAALGAQSGFDAFGAGSSFLAIREETERIGAVDQQRIRLLGANNQSVISSEKTQSKLAASNAKTQGFLKAATIAGSTGAKVGQLP